MNKKSKMFVCEVGKNVTLGTDENLKILIYHKCFVSLRPNCSTAAWTCSKAHFLHIAPFSISSLEWNSYFMYYYIIVEKLSKNLRGRLQYWFSKYKIDVINFINDFLCFVEMFYRNNSLIFCNKIYNNILQCEYLYALPQYSGVEILGRQRGAMKDIIINFVFKDFILW